MSGQYTTHLLDLSSPQGAAGARQKLADWGQALVRGRVFAVPWYEMNVAGTHAYANMHRQWMGSDTQQSIVALDDLAVVALGFNFRGSHTGGSMTARVSTSADGVTWTPTAFGDLVISSTADHGLFQCNPDADVIPQGTLWAVRNTTSGFLPAGSIDIEVWSYLAPV